MFLKLFLMAAIAILATMVDSRRLHSSLSSAALRQDSDECMTAEAMRAWQNYVQSTEPAHLQPQCKPELLQTRGPCQGIAVLFHGISSCPDQYDDLGPMLVAQGWDVLLPLNPGHGRIPTDLGNGTVRDDLSKVPADASGWRFFVDTIANVLKLANGPTPKATLGLSASGPVALLLGRYQNGDGTPLIQSVMPTSPAMGSTNLFTGLLRAARWIPGVGYIRPGWGATCEAARKQGRRGFCQFGIDQMQPVLALGQSIVNSVTPAMAGQRVQIVYTTGDGMVNVKNVCTYVAKAKADDAAVSSCVLPFSMHSFLSPHEQQDQKKYWLNEWNCRIVSFLTGGDRYGQDLQQNGLVQTNASGADAQEEQGCKLQCTAETCPYTKDTERPFTCPFPRI